MELRFESHPSRLLVLLPSMSNSLSVYTVLQGEVIKKQFKTVKNVLREFTKSFPSRASYLLQKAERIKGFLKVLVYFVSLLALTIFNNNWQGCGGKK